MDQKQQKIDELKNLLAQAKVRLESYKSEVEQRDRKIEELTTRIKKLSGQEEKIKMLERDSSQIMQQYEARLQRFQATMEDNQKAIQTHQKQNQTLVTSAKMQSSNLQKLSEIIQKGTIQLNKDVAQAIQELLVLQKLKECGSQLNKSAFPDKNMEDVKKILSNFLNSLITYVEKKRQGRLISLKKEMALKKELEAAEDSLKSKDVEIATLKQEGRKRLIEHKKELDLQKHEYNKKMPKDEPNIEYIKNLWVKVFVGPADVARMSLKVLQNILKFTAEEYKEIEKRIK